MSSRLARLGWRRWRLIAVTGVLVLCAGVAYAYFSGTGTGTAAAATGTLTAPGSPNATPGAGTVALSWNSVTPPSGGGPVTYYVSRNGGDAGGTCATSGSPTTATSCSDSGLAPGTYSYTVTAVWQSWTATSTGTSATLTSGAASQIVLTPPITNLASGATQTFTATVEDAAGNTVTTGPDAAAAIKFAQTTGSGSVTGLSTVTAAFGVATDTITGQHAGPVTLQASATLSGPGPTNSNTQTLTVTAGTATQIVLTPPITNLASGATQTFTATVEDAAGNTVTTGPDAAAAIKFAQTTGSGSVTGLSTVTAAFGVATDTITGQHAGPVTLQASATLSGPGPTNSNTQTLTVTAGTATQIVLTPPITNLASGATQTFTATVEDAAGNTVTTGPDAAAAIKFAQTTGSGSVTGLSTVTAAFGVATDTITGQHAGPVTLQASATLSGPGPTNSNTQTLTVTAGTATQIVLTPPITNLASGATQTFTATVEDAAGNTVTTGPDAAAAIKFAQTTGSGSVTGLSTVTAAFGVATDTITGQHAGPVTLQASATLSGPGPTNSNTQTLTVTAGVPTKIAIASGSGQSASNGSAFANPLVALVTDANGNPVPGVSVTFAAPSSGASGTFAPCASNPQQYDCIATTNSSGDATSSTVTANATTGSYNVAASATGTNTVNFALSNVADVLVITSAPVSGAASSTANLGLITVQQQTTGGTPVNAGSGGLTVNLSGPTGSSFAASQFGTSLTSVTIPSGSSSTTFWYGNSTAGTPTITASASGLISGTQKETVTTAPVGLGIVFVTGTGTPVVRCGTPSSSYACAVTGVGNAGSVTFYVTFVNSSGTQVVYSSTQASTIAETGQNPSSVTIAANQSSSNPNTLTAAHDGNSVKTSTLTFGSYTLTISVAS